MPALLLYTICALAAVALYLLVRPAPARGGTAFRAAGIILALAAFAWFLAGSIEHLAPGYRPEAFFVIFSVIALGSSIRLITHSRPVYCALYFVMVILSTAALFLLMGAEFMAFALVIVYAGAILVTYMFVLMLAQQAESPDDVQGQPEYDLVPREPATAAVVGFLMMALLATAIFEGVGGLDPGAPIAIVTPAELALPDEPEPTNIVRVGWALVAVFPVSLEVAGVILLLAMFGAAVLARRQMELSEDELREAAGMERLGPQEGSHQSPGGAS
jgi:NADH-quinone oxidoreductase subunit J